MIDIICKIMTSVGENGADRGERHRTGGETEAARSLQVGIVKEITINTLNVIVIMA